MSSARKAIRRSEVLTHSMEELLSNSVLRGGDVVHLQACPSPGLFPQGKATFAVTVLFEEDHLAAVVKPPGVLTHPTMLPALAYALQPTRLMRDAMDRPQPLHRLDKDTGGILLAGKTLPAAQELYRQFAEREVKQGV
jgi:23S rRNA pseudouridine1911/1915/1917 synthase